MGKFIGKYSNLARRKVVKLLARLSYLPIPPKVWVVFVNIYSWAFLRSISFQYSNQSGVFSAREDGSAVYFSNQARGIQLYGHGVRQRARSLFDSYCLSHVDFQIGDFVVDCGANYGDLWMGLEGKIEPSGYIAIEPNPLDFEMLTKNVPEEAIKFNFALGKENDVMDFYVASEGGDSSLIQPHEFDEIIRVNVVRLDQLFEQLGKNNIKLLKIEAEGYEPEILEGLGTRISDVNWIAIDGGFERGTEKEQTFTTMANSLYRAGFIMVDIFPPWSRALFKNTGYRRRTDL